MPLSFFYDLSLIIISMLALHFANKVFNIKLRLLSKFSDVDSYRAIIILTAVFIWIIFGFVSEKHFTSSAFGQIVIFSSIYLTNVPNESN